jgi:hypothetical protein
MVSSQHFAYRDLTSPVVPPESGQYALETAQLIA